MTSGATPRFWAAYRALPDDVRQLARKAYRLFQTDPHHPGLNFKKVHTTEPLYSIRIGYGYRALGLLEHDGVTWVWIGTHAGYDRLLRSL